MTDLRFPAHPTLAGAVWPEHASSRSRAIRTFLLAAAGSGLLVLSAYVQVPFYPVPMTLQTLAVLVIGAAFGTRLATATVVLYLLEGAIGLPVFAGTPERGIGLAYMMGPTGGFLLGYVFCVAVVGWFAERGADRSFPKLLGAMAAGNCIVFGLGFAWLAHVIGPGAAYTGGIAPFIVGDVVKTLLAALMVPAAWELLGKLR